MKPKTYRYEIELTQPMYPRHIADCMSLQGDFARTLLSVTDLRGIVHVYGSTYQAKDELPDVEPMTHTQMLDYYANLYRSTGDTVKREAYDWVLKTLEMDWVPGNMGMLTSYVRESIEALQQFQAHCETVGKFAEESVS